MLVALLADGHILVEGPPGLAKTRAVKTLAGGVQGEFQRILRGHPAQMIISVIRWRVTGIINWHIRQHCPGRDETLIQSKGIGKWFQCRSG